MIDRLLEMERRYEELGDLMGTADTVDDLATFQAYAKEHASLAEIVDMYRRLKVSDEDFEARNILQSGADAELQDLAREMLGEYEVTRDRIMDALRQALVPRDPNDDKKAIVEIRGAAGGEEANLFARELYRMYSLYVEAHGWKVEVLNLNETGIGGIREVIFEVSGEGAYGRLKYESGVHRVQRVPVTESGGRIHTSTATVIVLPEAEEYDLEIDPNDLRVDVYRAQGHGGQGVNTTDSAVRLTHLPSGLVVTCQNERSQLKNKASAMAVLRSRLLDLEEERRAKELGQARKSQVQTGDRSEKVRTYNFPQDRMTDHRINLTLHNLPSIMNGQIDGVIEELSLRERTERLEGAGI